jgi:hypothetical protein
MAHEPSRIYYDDVLGQYLDAVLESAFRDVYDETVSDKIALGKALDVYLKETFGEDAILFGSALNDVEQAIRWTTQLERLTINSAANYSAEPVADLRNRENNWIASCGDTEKLSVGRTLSQTVVLAGIQRLREIAYRVLNTVDEGATAH